MLFTHNFQPDSPSHSHYATLIKHDNILLLTYQENYIQLTENYTQIIYQHHIIILSFFVYK